MTRIATWENIGTNVNKCKSMEQVLKTSGLDYDVVKMPVFLSDGKQVQSRFATVRPDDDGLHIYDVVSDKFEVIQNRDAFDFVNYMGADVQFEKAGETANGMVYIIGKLPSVSILGDEFTPYVIFRNGFSGKFKISAAICPLRIVCQNQFNFAFKEANNTVGIRHVSNAEQKLEEAREVLKASADYMSELNRIAESYASIKLTAKQVDWVTRMMFPMNDTTNQFARNRMEKLLEQFKAAYVAEDNRNFKGTAWGLINAYTDFITHKEIVAGSKETRNETKFVQTTFKPMNKILGLISEVAA